MSCKIQTALVVLILCALAIAAPQQPQGGGAQECADVFGWDICNAGGGNGNGNCDFCKTERSKCCLDTSGVNHGTSPGACPDTGCCRDPPNCWDLNECDGEVWDFVGCSANEVCVNTIGSYRCDCKAGFKRDGQCTDINECDLTGEFAVCLGDEHSHTMCVNTEGSYRCDCISGYQKNPSTKKCEALWVTGDWSVCACTTADAPCATGSGSQTRSVDCPNWPCYGTEPVRTQSCCKTGFTEQGSSCMNINECALTGADKVCTEDPNTVCVDSDGSYCCDCISGYKRNPSTELCQGLYVTGDWSACSATCGSGIRTRTVTCPSNTDPCYGTKPTEGPQVCHSGQPCPAWITTWCDCPSCGTNVMQEGTVSCVGGTSLNVLVDESQCTGNKPGDSRPCSSLSPCPSWMITSSWGPCMATPNCGTGTQTRTVSCVPGGSGCDAGTKPAGSRECFTGITCPAWITSSWSDCPSCGIGVMRERTVSCVGGAALMVLSDDHCAGSGTKPTPSSQLCSLSPCDWKPSDESGWSACSATACCDTAGTQQRTVYCYDTTNGVNIDDSQCTAANKPLDEKSCVADYLCDADWISLPWSQCDVECGTGKQQRVVFCHDYSCQTATEEDCENKPDISQECVTGVPCDPGDKCSPNPCEHCGECTNDESERGYECTCHHGYTGDTCHLSGCLEYDDYHECVKDGHGCVLNKPGNSNCRPLNCD